MDSLTRDWDITDEGPMEDLLGIEVDYLPDGAIKLHQTSYVKKLGLREEIGNVVGCANEGDLEFEGLDHVADEEVSALYMLHAIMVFWVV